jgi:hypothetical protein
MMEDEYGPINVIVKPDIYKRDRNQVRMEPFLSVRGKLQKDGGTLNVIAYEVEALRVPGTPIRRRGLSRTYETSREGTGLTTSENVGNGLSMVHEGPESDIEELPGALPPVMDTWADPDQKGPTPFSYLTALRQHAPGAKSWK